MIGCSSELFTFYTANIGAWVHRQYHPRITSGYGTLVAIRLTLP